MDSLVTKEEVAAYLKKPPDPSMDALIVTGEALVAAEIGTSSLQYRSVVEKHKLLYGLSVEEVLELRDGPASGWLDDSVGPPILVDGTSYAITDTHLQYWSIKEFSAGFAKNAVLTLHFSAGWTPDTVPSQVKQAIIVTSATLFLHPDQATIMEKIGDYMRQTGALINQGGAVPAVTPQVSVMVRNFKRPKA